MKKRFIRSGVISALITFAVACFAALMMVIMPAGDSADLSYRTLDYDVTATADGNLKVTQRIDVKLRDRSDDDGDRPWKQLFQQYSLAPGNLTDITDISVRNVTNGIDYGHQAKPRLPDDVPQDEWDSDYANHWYIADVTDDDDNPQPYVPGKDGLTLDGYSEDKTVEIGWNIPTTVKPTASSSR